MQQQQKQNVSEFLFYVDKKAISFPINVRFSHLLPFNCLIRICSKVGMKANKYGRVYFAFAWNFMLQGAKYSQIPLTSVGI